MRFSILLLVALPLVAGCGGAAERAPDQADAAPAASSSGSGDLTPFELQNGIGPITTEIPAGPIDEAMAERGEKTFETKCSACHKFTEKYVGPSLGKVTERRTIAYVMNMILNPDGMTARHPAARQLLAEHLTQMPNLGLSQQEAREVVEYLREESSKPDSK